MTPLDLTNDSLLGGRVRLRQPAHGYRAAIDPVFLAASISAGSGERLLELGSGAGAVALCLAWRLPWVRLVGLEQQAELVDLARSNALANSVHDRLTFVHGSLVDTPPPIARGGFDQVLANPPFFEADRVTPPNSQTARMSELEGSSSLHDWLSAMLDLVRPKGRVTLIHRADRTGEILNGFNGRAGEVRLFPLWPRAGTPAKRIIVTARRGVRSPMRLQPGLSLHGSDNDYTAEADAVLRYGKENAGLWI